MNALKKILGALTSQVKRSNVNIPAKEIPHKITDDNQSIKDGVIYEKFSTNLRSTDTTDSRSKRKRRAKRKA